MALGKTVSYTPFQETSFGYGSSEIATAHSSTFGNATDIVKVIITHTSGNWDTTGHISTSSSGTAIASYNSIKKEWICEGQRDDVDAVLDTLSFYPADKPESRPYNASTNTTGFVTTTLKDNQTTGSYANENPPAIGDTVFSLKVYNGASVVSSNVVTFDPVEPTTGNQRPFFSVVPPIEDLNSTAHGTVAGGLVNFGTISHGTDTENVEVKCEFRNYGSSSTFTGTTYGNFTLDSQLYVGDKKPATANTSDARFKFTGSVAEAQTFLDNVRFYDGGNSTAFDMFLTISDGVVGSTLTKRVYFSQTLNISTFPAQSTNEDAVMSLTSGSTAFTGTFPDINSFTATFTFNQEGIDNIESVANATSYSAGVLTVTSNSSTFNDLKTAIDNVDITFKPDYNSSGSITASLVITGNTPDTYSYSSASQTINFTVNAQDEISNSTTSHTYNEDVVYAFSSGTVPQLIHGTNHNFSVRFTLSDTNAGSLGITGGSITDNSNGTFDFAGTRDALNTALTNLFYAPATDYNSNFNITFAIDRTSGDTTHAATINGTLSMTGVSVDEATFTAPASITWLEDNARDFASGLVITDNASTDSRLPGNSLTYTVLGRAKYLSGSTGVALTTATWSTTSSGSATVSGSGTVSSPLTITGSKADVNTALNNLRMTPDDDWFASPASDGSFFFEYRLSRSDGQVFYDYTINTPFSQGTDHEEFALPSQIYYVNSNSVLLANGNEMTFANIDNRFESSGVSLGSMQILDGASHTRYDAEFSVTAGYSGTFFMDSSVVTFDDYVDTGFVTSNFVNTNTFIVSGTKSQVNTKLATLKYYNDTSNISINASLGRDGVNIFNGSSTVTFLALPSSPVFSTTKTNGDVEFKNITDGSQDLLLTYDDGGSPVGQGIHGQVPSVLGDTWNIGAFRDSSESVALTESDNALNLTQSDYTITRGASLGSLANNSQLVSHSNYANNDTFLIPIYQTNDVTLKRQVGTLREIVGVTTSKDRILFNNFEDDLSTSAVNHRGFHATYRPTSETNTKTRKISFEDREANTSLKATGAAIEYTSTSYNSTGNSNADDTLTFGVSGSSFLSQHIFKNYNEFRVLSSSPLTTSNNSSSVYQIDVRPKFDPSDDALTSNYTGGVVGYRLYSHVLDGTTQMNVRTLDVLETSSAIYILLQRADGTNGGYLVKIPCSKFGTVTRLDGSALGSSLINAYWTGSTDNASVWSTTNAIWDGRLGTTASGEPFIATLDGTDTRVNIYHRDEGGSENWGLKHNVTKTDWSPDANNQTFSNYFSAKNHTYLNVDNGDIRANIKGYISVGGGLYYYNTSSWSEIVDPATTNNLAWYLSPDYAYSKTDNKFYELKQTSAPNEISAGAFDVGFGPQSGSQYHYISVNQLDNDFVSLSNSGSSTTNKLRVVRFTT